MQHLWQFRRGSLWLAAAVIVMLVFASPIAAEPGQEASAQMNCTFTASYPNVIVRSGPGREYAQVGSLGSGDTFAVIGQAAGNDGFVWWKGANETWVRSDLGDSNCPATCGNTVCEYGETTASCARDCQTGTSSTTSSASGLSSTGTGCVVETAQQCYASISCYPDCNVCSSWLNAYGCVTCRCDTASSSSSSGATGTGCVFASCEACIAAFPCGDGPCGTTECKLNEYGCPVCSTAP